MPATELTKEQRKRSIAEARGQMPQSPLTLSVMVLLGMAISGLIERSSFPTPTLNSVVSFPGMPTSNSNVSNERRYCDPPNMTILVMYETFFDSEEESREGDYDYSEMEEMDFQVKFTVEHEKAQWRWQAFIWGTFLAPIPASLLACFVGPGRVFGCCILLAGVVGLLIPQKDFAFQAIIVCIQGAFHGCLQPCALLLAVSSSSSEEKRSMFLALLSGSKLGFGVGEMVPRHLRPFTTCIVSVTWFATWVLMLNSPKLPTKKHPIPWRKLLTSRVVWMAVIAVLGSEIIQATTAYSLRQYLHIVYNYSNWFFFALPHGFTFITAFFCAHVSNYITKSGVFSKTTSRRIFVYVSHFLPSGILFVSAFVGCDYRAPLILFSISTVLGGAAYAGAYASILDVAPNFPAPVVALVCLCGVIARLFPVLLTNLIFQGLMPGSWRLTLSLSSLLALITAIFFMLRSSSRPPLWNYPDQPQPLKPVTKLTFENCLLRVLATKESEKFTRARACSTSVAGNINGKRLLTLKRASIS